MVEIVYFIFKCTFVHQELILYFYKLAVVQNLTRFFIRELQYLGYLQKIEYRYGVNEISSRLELFSLNSKLKLNSRIKTLLQTQTLISLRTRESYICNLLELINNYKIHE
jgi:hypothetical protein